MQHEKPSGSEPEFADEKAIAARFGIGKRALQMHRMRGTGPEYFKLGDGKRARVLYRLVEVRQWLELHRCGGEGATK